MTAITPGQRLTPPAPPQLRFTRLVRIDRHCFELHVIRWGNDNDTFGDKLPFDQAPGPGLYGNFLPWNIWLGEQLMYAASKPYLALTGEEMAEFVAVANYAARRPEALKAAAVPHTRGSYLREATA